jgi:hypothetical protein
VVAVESWDLCEPLLNLHFAVPVEFVLIFILAGLYWGHIFSAFAALSAQLQ